MLHYDMSMKDYLSSPAYGSSTLKTIMQTPADFKAAQSLKSKETDASSLGSMVHCLMEGEEKFDAAYALQPEDWGPKNRGTKKAPAGKQLWDAFKEENADKICVDFEDAQLVKRIFKAAQNHPDLVKARAGGKAEVVAFYDHSPLIKLKARADLICFESDDTIWDYKTTSENIDEDNLFKIVFNYGYHFSAAHYLKVFQAQEETKHIKNFGWIFVSTGTPEPHIIMVKAPEELLFWSSKDHDYALETLERCLHKNEWEGYSKVVKFLTIPDWARKMYE